MRFPHRKLLALIVVLGVSIAVVELSARAIITAEALPVSRASYSLERVSRPSFWTDSDSVFGVWHPPDGEYRHRTQCFDVTYTANSYGARDTERTRNADASRVVVLGDSFVEGWGVERSDRFSDRLESRTGLEHLNFGTSGTFGPTQYYLAYQSLAGSFDHDAVIVGILPENDFEDGDFDFGRRIHEDRYRPYFVRDSSGFRLTYYNELVWHNPLITKMFSGAKAFLQEFSNTFNLARYLWQVRSYRLAAGEGATAVDHGGSVPHSGYFDYSREQFEVLAHALRLLVDTAGDREVLLLTLPTRPDLARYASYDEAPLPRDMAVLAEETGAMYLDLLPFFASLENPRDSFHNCDGHWNAQGHAWAAEAITQSGLYETIHAAPPSP